MINSDAISDCVEQVVQQCRIPQVHLSVTRSGETVYIANGTLAIGVEPFYDSSCIQKLLVSLATLRLVANQSLSLDAHVTEFLPELCVPPLLGSLRIWHLLSNTSGYGFSWNRPDRDSAYLTLNQLMEHLRTASPLFAPGSVFSYQLEDYRLLAEILRRVTQMETKELVKRLILEPLGVDSGTGVDAPRYRFDPFSRSFYKSPNGSSPNAKLLEIAIGSLSATNLGAIAAALARGSQSGLAGAELLFVRRTEVPVANESAGAPYVFTSYGLGCGGYADGSMGHGGMGDGQCCAVRFHPESQLGVAIAMSGAVPGVRDMLVRRIMDLCDLPPRRIAGGAPEFEAQELIGYYECGDESAKLEVRARRGTIVCSLSHLLPDAIAGRAEGSNLEATFVLRDGRPILRVDSRKWCVSFFRDPTSGAPCLMYAGRAFKRTSRSG